RRAARDRGSESGARATARRARGADGSRRRDVGDVAGASASRGGAAMSEPTMKSTRRVRVGGWVLALLAAAAGAYAGTRWHADLAPWIGIDADHASVPQTGEPDRHTKQLWTCSMHPQVIREAPGVCPICHMQLTPLR